MTAKEWVADPKFVKPCRGLYDLREPPRQAARTCEWLQWDAGRLPVRDGSIDVVLVDMPFGKRVGTRGEMKRLYPR